MPPLPPCPLPSTFGKQQAGWQALLLLPSFPLTGNSCPASSQRPCQHPPLEYFRGKSENDQQPPKCLFSHMPYMGILGSLGFELPPLGRKKMKHNDEDIQSQEAPSVHNCLHTPTPSCHTGTRQPSQAHIHTRFHICSTASVRFPEEHSQPASASTSTRTTLSCQVRQLHFHSSHGTGPEKRGTDDRR